MSTHKPASVNDPVPKPIAFAGNTPRRNQAHGKSLIVLLNEKRKQENITIPEIPQSGQKKEQHNDNKEDRDSQDLPVTLPYLQRSPTARQIPRSTSTPMGSERGSVRRGTPSTVLDMSRDEETPLPYQQSNTRVNDDFPSDSGDTVERAADGWQDNKTLAECNHYMLTNEIGCDVTFLVGETGEAVMAHSYILMSRSSRFYQQIMRWADQISKLITIPDVQPETFRSLLSYLYTGDIELDVKLANSLLYAAHKYGPSKLKTKCFHYLLTELSSDNVNIILENAHKYNEKDVYQRCLRFINVNAVDVLKTSNFKKLCRDCVEEIVKSDNLNADEYVVYGGLVMWANGECARRKLQPNDTNRREVLESLLYHVRFPTMDVRTFTQKFSQSNVLKPQEKIVIYQYVHGQKHTLLQRFNTTSRKKYVVNKAFATRMNGAHLKLEMEEANAYKPMTSTHNTSSYAAVPYERHYTAALKDPNQTIQRVIRFKGIRGSWQMKGPDAISFRCSAPIILHGVQIFGPYKGKASYTVDFTVFDDMKTEIRKETINISTEETKVYDVLLTDAIRISEGRVFTVQTVMHGDSTIRGIDGVSAVNTGGVKFEFVNSNKSLNGTDVTMGQIPALLFSKPYE